MYYQSLTNATRSTGSITWVYPIQALLRYPSLLQNFGVLFTLIVALYSGFAMTSTSYDTVHYVMHLKSHAIIDFIQPYIRCHCVLPKTRSHRPSGHLSKNETKIELNKP